MRNVTLNFPDDFLERLDRFRDAKKLKRNAALMVAFDDYQSRQDAVAVPTGDSRAGTDAPSQKPLEHVGGSILPQDPNLADGCIIAVNPAKMALAKAVLVQGQKYVGVHPTVLDDSGLAKVHDPDAEQGLKEFYVTKGSSVEKSQKPDPPGWDEFDQSGKDSE